MTKCSMCRNENIWLVAVIHTSADGLILTEKWCLACLVDQGKFELQSRRDEKHKK